ncbi:hypothetical protein SAMN06295989_10643 [Methanohalophilus euhalobius]|uniref:Uncharacterized protein n=1 Tax=Methanohalophilus euhalobius TaxID=51203 RepID=A0A285FZI3_9EURY|nr:hypothetical protein SAMN06295989_10643 [Methanohalophilus euhalobius]
MSTHVEFSWTQAENRTKLPFPFITGAYVNGIFRSPYRSRIDLCYHSLLSRVLMSTIYIVCANNEKNQMLPFPFITGAYVNGISTIPGLAGPKVTIPFYHGCLCQQMSLHWLLLRSCVTIPFYHGCLCQRN